MKKISRLSFFVAAFLLFSQATQAVFTDVASDHKYFEAINYLQQNGIVEGYEDGSYRPDTKVNRAEALKIILLGSEVLVPEIADQDIFPDVLHGTWYAKYAAKGKNLGIVSGDSDTGMFRPGDTINLAEILKILIETNDIELRTEDDMERRPYADVPTDAWFAPYFDYADSITLLEEDEDYNVFPATEVTRGLMAQLMHQIQMKPEGYQEGEASYYGEKFHGKGTASGEVFDASGLTAAHRTLPFGTWLRVRNLENNEEVYVRVNDRGPYAGDNRIIDLSKAAFEAISPLSRGVIQVSITPVDGPPGDKLQASASCPDSPDLSYYSENTFENITLAASLPNLHLADEVLFIEGTSSSDNDYVSAFLADESDEQLAFATRTEDDGGFKVGFVFPEPGEYKLGILPGQSGSSIVETIHVLPISCLEQLSDGILPAPTGFKISLDEGDSLISWDNSDGYSAFKVTFIQGSRQQSYLIKGSTELRPHYRDFEGWQAGDVELKVQGAHLESNSFLETGSITWSSATNMGFKADMHHQYVVDPDKVVPLSLPSSLTSSSKLTLKVDPKVNVDERGQVILPSGLVEEILLESPSHNVITNSLGTDVYPSSAADVRLNYTPQNGQLHFFEINDEQGLAVVNIPVYPKNVYPLIPNPVDLASLKPEVLSSDLGGLKNEMLQLVNQDREAHGMSAVSLDSSLSQLAQSKAEDMVTRDYFGHWNPDGLTANDLRKNYAITQYVSENIARDVNVSLAQYGLMRSASHRGNILNSEWQRAGFGLAQDGDKGTIFVQIFSDDPINLADVPDLRSEIVSALNAKRGSAIQLQDNLSSLSQAWADKWTNELWCDLADPACNPLTAPDGSFTDSLRDNEVLETLGAYYRGDSSFDSAKDAVIKNAALLDSRWKKIGIGIKQDDLGIIHFFITYTE